MDKAVLYDTENPEVWKQFVKFAMQLINAGYKRIGSKMIFERIRWETAVSGNDGFKINNNYTPYYSRKFEKEFPQYEGMFAKRSR